MTEKQGQTPYNDNIMDTQELLRGVELPEDEAFDLEAILAEYGSHPGREESPDRPEEAAVPALSDVPGSSGLPDIPAACERPELPGEPEEAGPAREPKRVILHMDDELEGISPQAMFGLDAEEPGDEAEPAAESAAEAGEEPRGEEDFPAISMEDVVASTVDAVKEEQERRQEKWKKKWEKEQKKQKARDAKRREPAARQPLPEIQEPPLGEAAAQHRRRYFDCRRSMLTALPMLALLWLPWVLEQFGAAVPYFSESTDNAALCILIPQAILCGLCWPVFRAAVEGLSGGACTVYFVAALCNVVTILDEVTLLLLPQRSDVAPLGGVAAVTAVCSLWGLVSYHRGMWETFRTASMGRPIYAVDCCEGGIAKGRGGTAGFYTRAVMEDTATQWQRLLLPVLTVASLVFAVLSSVGQGRGQDLLWSWSVILCASSALVCPLVYCVPFGRLALRLARSGAAVAGQYGASALSASRQIVVTDSDLFPAGTMTLNGLKLYGEERGRAISYAATLAVQGGGILGKVFDELSRGDRIPLQPLDHFHIHDDCGLSGIIHGETVLLGSAAFMRHKAIKLPATMPSKSTVCLAVDGELTAVFSAKYNTCEPVESALRALGRNGLQLNMAVRDGNITAKLLKTRFGTDGGARFPELSERLALSDPERRAGAPNGLLYREGFYSYVDLVAGSRRLCHVVRLGNLLSMLSSIFGALLGFYLTFAGSYGVLTPLLLLTYLLLWVLPMLPLLWGVDKT